MKSIGFALVVLVVFGFKVAGEPTGEMDRLSSLTYPASADFRVLELQSRVNWSADGMGPFVRVYGDGRVHLHRPSVMKDSGDFEAWLSSSDLDLLVHRLVDTGLLEFDPEAARAELLEAKKRRREEGQPAPMITDAGTVVLTIRFEEYSAPHLAQPIQGSSKALQWNGVDFDAENYPEVRAIQPLHRAVSVIWLLGDLARDASARGEPVLRLPVVEEPVP